MKAIVVPQAPPISCVPMCVCVYLCVSVHKPKVNRHNKEEVWVGGVASGSAGWASDSWFWLMTSGWWDRAPGRALHPVESLLEILLLSLSLWFCFPLPPRTCAVYSFSQISL